MSLEQQIGALVKASENLTGAVNGKIGEIDKKVVQSINELKNAFPAEYLKFAVRTHYIDPNDGSDTNDGLSWGKAFKTWQKAFDAGDGALTQNIFLGVGRHILNGRVYPKAQTVTMVGDNQSHYPNGDYSDATSTVIHIDKTTDIRAGIVTKLFGNIFMNNCVYTFEGSTDNTSVENCIIYGLGSIGLRLPLFVFDSVNRGVMCAGNNFNPFSSLGCELPQFTGAAAYHVKGSGSTCILNLDRSVDRTSGMNQKYGSVVVLS
ncbi:hypothetical protein [Photobacterium iliopiscarium]|uniref:Uncharacterized protein n=1 Tax=Photobacterium iliopiscarium TaxID=56192 RepID=A0A2T3MNG7_9GAMM|nr:hypothetical protein [Photobacterium iliopiscarium]PSV98296.1 hypothetical protein C9I88_06430 [Photobacterium iliopiscarium]